MLRRIRKDPFFVSSRGNQPSKNNGPKSMESHPPLCSPKRKYFLKSMQASRCGDKSSASPRPQRALCSLCPRSVRSGVQSAQPSPQRHRGFYAFYALYLTFPSTIVYFIDPDSFRPLKGVFLPLERNLEESTVHSSSRSAIVRSAAAPSAISPPSSPSMRAGLPLIFAAISGSVRRLVL